MDGAELSMFSDITEAFVMLHAKNYMTEEQKKTTVQKLLGRYLNNPEEKDSDNILELISKLDTKYNERTLMTILPTLVDQNVSTCTYLLLITCNVNVHVQIHVKFRIQ